MLPAHRCRLGKYLLYCITGASCVLQLMLWPPRDRPLYDIEAALFSKQYKFHICINLFLCIRTQRYCVCPFGYFWHFSCFSFKMKINKIFDQLFSRCLWAEHIYIFVGVRMDYTFTRSAASVWLNKANKVENASLTAFHFQTDFLICFS